MEPLQDRGLDPTQQSGSEPPAGPSAPQQSHWQAPEYVPGLAPGFEFGGAGERLIAYIVDALIASFLVLLIVILAGLVVGAGAAGGSGVLAVAGVMVILLALLIVPFGYFPYFWATSGSTPGMRMFGLKVVRDIDGGPIGAGPAVLRLIGYWCPASCSTWASSGS